MRVSTCYFTLMPCFNLVIVKKASETQSKTECSIGDLNERELTNTILFDTLTDGLPSWGADASRRH